MLKKNDMLVVNITAIGAEGEGIAKVDGFPLFIKDTVIGDEAEVKVIKVKKNYGYARVEHILTPSPDRVTPRCDVARACGGCTMQHLSYEKQLEYKWNKVKDSLERIGGFADIANKMEPIMGMDEPFYYRNKAQFPVGLNREGEVVTGFYAGRTHSIVPQTACCIQAKENQKILERVLGFLRKYADEIPPYDEATHTGIVRHILTRVGFVTGEIMVCLVVNAKKLPHEEDLVETLRAIPGMRSICLNSNQEKTNVILGQTCRTLWGSDTITDYIGNVQYQISPLSFYQVNPVQTKVLYEKALEYADLHGNEVVWDLYCGIGTISLFLAQKAKEVYGVEIIPQAIEDARRNAELNHITNATFFVGKAEKVLPEQYEKNHVAADVICVDPPRKGCDKTLLDTILAMAPKRIVYVSCDPATLARDCKILCESGKYEVKKVAVVDQFAHSKHVETVVLLSQRKADDYVEVELELDELDVTSAESKATYAEIKDYVKDKYGVNVHTSYIAQVKRMCGLDMGVNYNKSKKENPEVKQCPQEKVEYIKDALRHYNMI